MESAVWGLIGTLVGALASIATTYISSRSASNLQREVTSHDRMERNRAFQRETLIALQDALNDALRMRALAHLEDITAFKESGKWGEAFLSEEVNEGMRLSNRKVAVLIERVADDPLRNQVKNVIKMSGEVRHAKSPEEAEALFQKVAEAAFDAMEDLGRVLRSLY